MKSDFLDNSIESTSVLKEGAPIELWLFGFFALIVTLIDFGSTLLGFTKFRETIIPLTGWLPCMAYMFSFYPVISLILKLKIKNAIIMRNVIIVNLFLGIAYGSKDIFINDLNYYNNPYLDVSKWRPFWTMIIPFVWILIMFSPRIKKYCFNFKKN